jgi:hypothetical protein
MDVTARRKLRPLAAALAAASLAGCPGPAKDDPAVTAPFPAKGGIQQNLSLATLTSGGWTICAGATTLYSGDTFASSGGFDPLVSGCSGAYMMLACGADGSDTLTLAAADERSVVALKDALSLEVPHVANGVAWYWEDGADVLDYGSIGFAPAAAAVTRAGTPQCDWAVGETDPEKRLCWSTDVGDLIPGYRCGAETNSTMVGEWKRYILVHD